MSSAWAENHLEQIRRNVKYLKSRIKPETRFMGVVKADAYGHGVARVARVLAEEGVSHFAVAMPQEGVEMRELGFREPILLLGHTFAEDYPLLLRYGLTPSIFTMEQARRLDEFAARNGQKATIHIKIDTGMGRLGFIPDDELPGKIAEIIKMPHLYTEGIFSHFATAPQLSDTSYCDMQFAKFTKLLGELESAGIRIPLRHISNSGATILFPRMQLDMVRPGTAIYGLWAGKELETFPGCRVYPAMEVKARLAYVKPVPAGTRVSYSTFETKRPSVLGIVPRGYVDGIFRCLANRGEVLLHGHRCPMVGNVCMDQFAIDITDIDDPQEGDEVVIIGRQGREYISAEETAEKCGTISIEFLCGLGRRMPIIYKD